MANKKVNEQVTDKSIKLALKFRYYQFVDNNNIILLSSKICREYFC